MKRIMFIGPSQCGKTSLCQRLQGDRLRYHKTQAVVWSPLTIDTPGEYLENRCLYSALLACATEADVIALVLNADADHSPFSPGFTLPMNRPTLGLITKTDLAPPVQLTQAGDWLRDAGAGQIMETSALTGAGIGALLALLTHQEFSCPTP